MKEKIEKFEFKMNRQSKPRITDEQIKVLKQVCSDAELLGEFLAKMCWYIRETTNATEFFADFEVDATVITKEVLKGTLRYRSD